MDKLTFEEKKLNSVNYVLNKQYSGGLMSKVFKWVEQDKNMRESWWFIYKDMNFKYLETSNLKLKYDGLVIDILMPISKKEIILDIRLYNEKILLAACYSLNGTEFEMFKTRKKIGTFPFKLKFCFERNGLYYYLKLIVTEGRNISEFIVKRYHIKELEAA